MSDDSMRPQEEVQRAHDLLVQLIIHPELREMMEPATLDRMVTHADVLCWVLRHDHNQNFAVKMTTLEATLADLGFELAYESEEPEAEPARNEPS
jgi:hypothetical protein